MRRLLILCLVFLAIAEPIWAQADRTISSEDAAGVAKDLFRALDLKFEAGQRVLHPSTLSALDAVAAALDRFPDLCLEIAGHTDASGSADLNLRVSEERAQSVKRYLVARHGVESGRLETVGFGESVPVATNASAAGRAMNRRVEFRVVDCPGSQLPLPGGEDEAVPVPVDIDSLRAAYEREVEEAVRTALAASADTLDELTEVGARLQERLALLEGMLAEEEVLAEQEAVRLAASPIPPGTRFALLPFSGVYLGSGVPIVLGLRADIPTSLLGAARLWPEVFFGFRPDERSTAFGVNLAFPVRIGSRPELLPFLGAGIGFQDVERLESVLNLMIGAENRFDFGVLFAEFLTQDFFDFNRLVVGFRLNF